MDDFSDEDMSRDPKGKERGKPVSYPGLFAQPAVRASRPGTVLQVLAYGGLQSLPRDRRRRSRGGGMPVGRHPCRAPLRCPWSRSRRRMARCGRLGQSRPWKRPQQPVWKRASARSRQSPRLRVLATEAERYGDVDELQFERKSYRIRGGSRRSIRLLAPTALARSAGRDFDLELSTNDFRISGARKLVLSATFGIAVCKLTVAVLDDDAAPTRVIARLGEHEAETELRAATAAGRAGSLSSWRMWTTGRSATGGTRTCWRSERGTRRSSGISDRNRSSIRGRMSFTFRVLLAEVVAEALCARRLQGNIESNPRDFEGMSWDDYYRHFARMMSEFLPKAHGLMAPGG